MSKFGEKRDVSLRLPQPGRFSAVSCADIVSDAGVRAADIIDAARPQASSGGGAAPSPSLMRSTASSRRAAEDPGHRAAARALVARWRRYYREAMR